MTPLQNERYARHVMLRPFGKTGQQRLLDARVLVVGLGGLGSPVSIYLAAAGVGQLTLADFDVVDLSNLQRQVVHRTADVGRLKVDSAKDTLRALNPDVKIKSLAYAPDEAEMDAAIAAADLVVDATDNFETRHAMNRACWHHRVPLVSGAAIRMEGLVSVFDPTNPDSPCYRCLYPEQSIEGEACAQVGVLSPLLGIIGSVQATEAIKLLAGMGEALVGRVLMIDALDMQWHALTLKKATDCPVCSVAN